MEDFVARFSAWTTENSIFVPVAQTRAALNECGFAILLASKKPVLAGICVVLDTFEDSNNDYRLPGLLLGIQRLGAESQEVFALLNAARVARKPIATPSERATRTGMPSLTDRPKHPVARATSPREPDRMPRATPPIVGPKRRMTGERVIDDATPTHVGLDEKTEPRVLSTARQTVAEGSTRTEMLETRTPGSPFILPANPLMNLSDESLEGFVDCRLFEATDGFADGSPQLDAPEGNVVEPAEPELVAAPTPTLRLKR